MKIAIILSLICIIAVTSTLLESKVYHVIEQIKYHLKWVDGVAVRGPMKRRVYWIGIELSRFEWSRVESCRAE